MIKKCVGRGSRLGVNGWRVLGKSQQLDALLPLNSLTGYCSHLSKYNFRCLAHAVCSAMVGVYSHQECSPVRVPQPRRDRWNIHPGFDCGRREGIAQIMVGQQSDPEFLARPCEGFSRLTDAQNLGARVDGSGDIYPIHDSPGAVLF